MNLNIPNTRIHHITFIPFSSLKSFKANSRAGQIVQWVEVSAVKLLTHMEEKEN